MAFIYNINGCFLLSISLFLLVKLPNSALAFPKTDATVSVLPFSPKSFSTNAALTATRINKAVETEPKITEKLVPDAWFQRFQLMQLDNMAKKVSLQAITAFRLSVAAVAEARKLETNIDAIKKIILENELNAHQTVLDKEEKIKNLQNLWAQERANAAIEENSEEEAEALNEENSEALREQAIAKANKLKQFAIINYLVNRATSKSNDEADLTNDEKIIDKNDIITATRSKRHFLSNKMQIRLAEAAERATEQQIRERQQLEQLREMLRNTDDLRKEVERRIKEVSEKDLQQEEKKQETHNGKNKKQRKELEDNEKEEEEEENNGNDKEKEHETNEDNTRPPMSETALLRLLSWMPEEGEPKEESSNNFIAPEDVMFRHFGQSRNRHNFEER